MTRKDQAQNQEHGRSFTRLLWPWMLVLALPGGSWSATGLFQMLQELLFKKKKKKNHTGNLGVETCQTAA